MVSRCFPGGYNVKLYISRGMVSMVVTGFFVLCKRCKINDCETIDPLDLQSSLVCMLCASWKISMQFEDVDKCEVYS